MKEKNLFLSLIAIIILFLTILYTNIGYATEKLINHRTNYNNLSQNFSVEFNQNSKYLNNNISIINSQKALLKNISLTHVGETKKVTVPVISNINDLSVKLEVTTSNSNPEYFAVTSKAEKSILTQKSNETLIEVTVQLIKEPLYFNESTEITIDVITEPIYKK